MRILITGHNGFVGSYVMAELEKRYDAMDLFPFSFREGKFSAIYKNVDVVIHLAAAKNGTEEEMLEANAFKVKSLLDACKYVEHFIYISTEFIEAFDSAYTRSKRIGEIYTQDSGLNCTILRMPHLYSKNDGFMNSKPFTSFYKLMKNVKGVRFRSKPEDVRVAAKKIVQLTGNKKYYNRLVYFDDI